ncbi:enoyl-CoA hydratase/isomerase family protein [Halobacillus sp. A5]|uniref:enoyl-CoA hydratase/isomerase family protein n=1 Tax=Halobacillus sp. A5 TaxID=2880263 RepID=UPI0020A6CC37|nr:enoyl-CoA hydratase-related protein [Halobacillus sp. A5]MCP3028352.1 enoyl-CoA hydratase/isomerase family protein [Halobacillus sp. A5]
MESKILTSIEKNIMVITLNRPEMKNALDGQMIDEWVDALEEAQRNNEVHVIVVTGKGSAFCAGGDVGGMKQDQTALDNKNKLWKNIHRVPLTLKNIDKPVIAAINGPAVGAGLDMALMCDLRTIVSASKVSEGYVRVGLVPGDGGAYFLPQIVGEAKALELLWTGDFISSEKAYELGLVNHLYEEEEFFSKTMALAERIASGPQVAIRMTKRAVKYSRTMELEPALDLMSSHYSIIKETEDHKEGVKAFKEKRRPVFRGV